MVDVIKSQDQIDQVREAALRNYKDPLYSQLWTFGVNVGLLVTDCLKITMDSAKDARDGGQLLLENSRAHVMSYRINKSAKRVINTRLKRYPDDIWLFQAHSNNSKGSDKPISATRVYNVLNEIGDQLGIDLGNHSMRKARGIALIRSGFTIEEVALFFKQKPISNTYQYLGLTKYDPIFFEQAS